MAPDSGWGSLMCPQGMKALGNESPVAFLPSHTHTSGTRPCLCKAGGVLTSFSPLEVSSSLSTLFGLRKQGDNKHKNVFTTCGTCEWLPQARAPGTEGCSPSSRLSGGGSEHWVGARGPSPLPRPSQKAWLSGASWGQEKWDNAPAAFSCNRLQRTTSDSLPPEVYLIRLVLAEGGRSPRLPWFAPLPLACAACLLCKLEMRATSLLGGHSAPGTGRSPLHILTHFILKMDPWGHVSSSSNTKPEHWRNVVWVNYASVILLSHCITSSKDIFILNSISAYWWNALCSAKGFAASRSRWGKL